MAIYPLLIRPKAIKQLNLDYQRKLATVYHSFYIKTHFIDRNIALSLNESEVLVHHPKLTSSSAPTVFRQAFIVDMKFDVVGDDTSSLASFRKLLTVILSGIMAAFERKPDLRTHLANIFATVFRVSRRKIESFRQITRLVPRSSEIDTPTSPPETKPFRNVIQEF